MERGKSESDPPLAETLSAISPPSPPELSPSKCFKSLQWWKNATLMSVLYARQCVVPACLWIGAVCVIVFPGLFMISTAGVSAGLMQILQGFIAYVLALVLVIPLMGWCFAAWLVRLTAYSSAYSTFSAADMLSLPLDKTQIVKAQLDALEKTRLNKAFLTKFWSTLTVFLLLPFFIFFISILVLTCTYPAVLGESALKLSAWALMTLNVCCSVSGLYLTAVSFAGICVSSNASSDPVDHAKQTMALSFKFFFPLMIISAISVFINMLISSPRELLQGAQPLSLTTLTGLWLPALEELWRGATSTVLWTLTLAPVCEYLRGKLSHVR